MPKKSRPSPKEAAHLIHGVRSAIVDLVNVSERLPKDALPQDEILLLVQSELDFMWEGMEDDSLAENIGTVDNRLFPSRDCRSCQSLRRLRAANQEDRLMIDKAKRAKAAFQKSHPGVGVAFSNNPNGKGYCLAVRVNTEAEQAAMPTEVLGVPVLCRVLGVVKKVNAPPDTDD